MRSLRSPAPLVASLAIAVLIALGTASPRSATAATAVTKTQATTSESPVPVLDSTIPPPGRRLSAAQVIAIAEALPKMKSVRAKYPGSFPDAYLKGPARWQVSFFSRHGAKEIGQVIIADASGRVLEQWTGFQIAWTMARGYPGAFGRHVNALYIWLPLCVLFLLPFIDPRRPLQLLHLDLLVLLSFSVSLAFFNHANIYASVPLTYPPLIYLLGRMLWLLRRPREGVGASSGRAGDMRMDDVRTGTERAQAGRVGTGPAVRPLRLLVPVPWLALGVVFLLGFRIALNVTDSNVIDVGYAGVIGADKIVHGDALYGGWPSDNEHGDTYGPVTYEAYVPFEQIFGWSGTWDDLPAAHAAAIAFDLLALGLIFLLGMRLRGPTLGVALAYAWVSYPFTLYALESNSNDTLVAVLLLATLLVASSAPARGVFAALAGLAKLAPLALVPVLATHGLWGERDGDRPATSSPGRRADDELEHNGREGVQGGGLEGCELRGVEGGGLEGHELRGVEGGGGAGGEDEYVRMRRKRARTRARALLAFFFAFILTAAIVSIPALTHDSLRTIYERTIVYQANRGSPFSVWGLYGGPALHGIEAGVEVAAVVLALALAVIPRRADVFGLAAACAAIVIAVQLGVEHWFYLYIPWFFPLVIVALLGVRVPEAVPAEQDDLTAERLREWSAAPPGALGAASGSARLRLPSAAWPSSG